MGMQRPQHPQQQRLLNHLRHWQQPRLSLDLRQLPNLLLLLLPLLRQLVHLLQHQQLLPQPAQLSIPVFLRLSSTSRTAWC
jgi:hypothetical protein